LLELFGRAVTIVGCGSVGTECAKRFKAFGCRVTGVDIAPRRDDAYDAMLPIEKLDEALPASDVLVLTVPLTKATERLIDARRLELMNETAVVVNISRGRVIDETALAEKLRTRRLMGAVLDVFETEPLPASSPLWELDNVILTPHNSFVGSGNAARLTDTIFNSLSVVK
jgi:phosphoglycerate dehydrogenase-like enzyme